MYDILDFFSDLGLPLLLLIIIFLMLLPFIVTCGCCGAMASRLGRSVIWWVFLSIFSLNPLVCIACLYALGETKKHRFQRIMEEEKWKMDNCAKG